jgi:hypothetical protein
MRSLNKLKRVEKIPEHVRKFILPFAVVAKDRLEPFTKDMEMAAIFYLAESDRKKGEGRVLKKPAETLTFITETCYPIWIVPWRRRILFFDGLGLSKHPLSYNMTPDIRAFNNDVKAGSKSHEAYCVALSQNENYFQNFVGKEEKTIEGLIIDPQFTQDFNKYLSEAKEIEKLETTKAFLSPSLDKSDVLVSVEELTELRGRVKEEIKTLEKTMIFLSKWTKDQVKALQAEIKKTMKRFNNDMEKTRPRVMAKIKKIQEKRDKEITRISRKFDGKLRSIHKNRVRIEKTIERLLTYIERCEADIKACRDRKDEIGELQLDNKLKEAEKKVRMLKKEIQDIDKEIEKVQDSKKIKVAEARVAPDDRIEETMKALHDIEAAKEARIRMEQHELEELEGMTGSIINQINQMIKTKEAALNAIDNTGALGKRRKCVITFIPFYFVCYETNSSKRYVVYPPSVLGSMGIKTKLKGIFGASKMKSFLQPRSQVITNLINQLIDLTQENPVFEKEIIEAGIEASILQTTELREAIKKGLTELVGENWIAKDELQYLERLL